jgi:hypothetical protein
LPTRPFPHFFSARHQNPFKSPGLLFKTHFQEPIVSWLNHVKSYETIEGEIQHFSLQLRLSGALHQVCAVFIIGVDGILEADGGKAETWITTGSD